MIKTRVKILKRPKGIVNHVGLAVGQNQILHNTPEKGEHISTISEFSAGKQISVISKEIDDEIQLSNRLNDTIKSPQEYHLLKNNCEHTISKIVDGEPKSEQLQNVVALFVILGVIIICCRENK